MSCNPFLVEDIDEVSKSHEDEQSLDETPLNRISYDTIAKQLLSDNLVLTALELHTEFQELGKPLAYLRDYFSNPGNFERIKPSDIQASSPSAGLRTLICQSVLTDDLLLLVHNVTLHCVYGVYQIL